MFEPAWYGKNDYVTHPLATYASTILTLDIDICDCFILLTRNSSSCFDTALLRFLSLLTVELTVNRILILTYTSILRKPFTFNSRSLTPKSLRRKASCTFLTFLIPFRA